MKSYGCVKCSLASFSISQGHDWKGSTDFKSTSRAKKSQFLSVREYYYLNFEVDLRMLWQTQT